jgi:L-rhamnose mutarotase
MQRLYFALDLDDDPAAIAEYVSWHRPERIWPQIVTQLRGAGIHELEIFRYGNRLVMVKQMPDGASAHGPARLEDQGRMEKWEQLMSRFQRPLPGAKTGEKWAPMARIFSLREALGAEKP